MNLLSMNSYVFISGLGRAYAIAFGERGAKVVGKLHPQN